MTHLRIEQNNIPENVSGDVITKLYQLAISGTLDSSSNLAGTLNTNATYQEYIDELEGQFLDLHINATNKYMMFADPEVQNVLLNAGIGDGIGITLTEVALVNRIGNIQHGFNSSEWNGAITDGVFQGNTLITSFNELKKFTQITKLDYQAFSGCSNLESIDLTNITTIGQYGGLGYCSTFNQCSKLVKIYAPNLQYIKFINRDGYSTIGGCNSLVSIDLPSFINTYPTNTSYFDMGPSSFPNLSSLQYINLGHAYANFDTVNQWSGGVFSNCSSLKVIDFGDSAYKFNDFMIENCPNLEAVVIRNNNVVPVIQNKGTASVANLFNNSNTNIYVPDSLISNYQQDSYWSNLYSNIHPLSEYSKSDYITEP